MAWLFASGHVVDLILLVIAAEAAVLLGLRRRTGGGVPGLAAFLLSGACLLLALRVALTDGWWGWTGFWLAAAGAAHVLDLRGRWKA